MRVQSSYKCRISDRDKKKDTGTSIKYIIKNCQTPQKKKQIKIKNIK